MYYFAFPPAINKSSCCSTSLPAFGVVRVLDFDHPNWWSKSGSSSLSWYATSLGHVMLGTFSYAYLSSCLSMSWIFVHFSMGLLVFFLLKLKSSLCILDKSLFSDISFAKNIFLHSVACLFILSTVSLTEEKFLILMKSRCSILSVMDLALILYLQSHVHTQGHLGFVLYWFLGIL